MLPTLAASLLRPAFTGLCRVASTTLSSIGVGLQQQQQTRGLLWSIEVGNNTMTTHFACSAQHSCNPLRKQREKGHTYKDTKDIINEAAINSALEKTKSRAADPLAISEILEAAKERSFLTNITPGDLGHLPQTSNTALI